MSGYLRYPALSPSFLAFVFEDSLWVAPRDGGAPRRLSGGEQTVHSPLFDEREDWLYFTSDRGGVDQAFRVPVAGGVPEQLTYEADGGEAVCLRPGGGLVFRSRREAAVSSQSGLYELDLETRRVARLPVGWALHASFHADGDRLALGLSRIDSARWKRYRGGMQGDVWSGSVTSREFRRIVGPGGNPVLPTVVGERVYYLSDEDGIANLWSVPLEGGAAERHTDHRDHYLRHLSRCGNELVYQKAGRLFRFDTASGEERELAVDVRPSGVQLLRKFVSARESLQGVSLAPSGRELLTVVRGKALLGPPWGGGVRAVGREHGVRYRLPGWLGAADSEARELVLVSDEGGEEGLELFDAATLERRRRFELSGRARTLGVHPAPKGRKVAVTDYTGGLAVVDLELEEPACVEVDKAAEARIPDVAWSPDGRYLAWVTRITWLTRGGLLHVRDLETGEEVVLNDVETPTHSPSFDPKGRFLFVLSERNYDPVLDPLMFTSACVSTTRAYAYVLQEDGLSPLDARWADAEEDKDKDDDKEKDGKDGKKDKVADDVRVDFADLAERIVELADIGPGEYSDLSATSSGFAYLDWPLYGLRGERDPGEEEDEKLPTLVHYDLLAEKRTDVLDAVRDFEVRGEKTLLRTTGGLRILKTGEEPPEEPSKEGFNRHTGKVDLGRMRAAVVPAAEWEQMFEEAWRLQRDFFWSPDMAGVDWPAVRERYRPLLARVATRGELSDVIWELQGELGTSHAYEWGGDHPDRDDHSVGLLGADLVLDEKGWRVARLLRGDPWDPKASSPLAAPGVRVREGEYVLAVDGRACTPDRSPDHLLVDRAGTGVELLVGDPDAPDKARRVPLRTLASERALRYRDWVRRNRAFVHERTGGRVGYLHVPDMGGEGLAEFHRAWRAASRHEALVVDVRDNGGGFVSELLLQVLRKKVIGHERSRHGAVHTYPADALRGPMVALCDGNAGSDGDMFCKAFREYGLGVLVGKRTWGGVTGIDVIDSLADGGVVTQPEYAMHFNAGGWDVENFGVEPDVEVDNDPASVAAGRDPQLERGIEEVLRLLGDDPVAEPDWAPVPSRALPTP